jgi:hypothetical protein
MDIVYVLKWEARGTFLEHLAAVSAPPEVVSAALTATSALLGEVQAAAVLPMADQATLQSPLSPVPRAIQPVLAACLVVQIRPVFAVLIPMSALTLPSPTTRLLPKNDEVPHIPEQGAMRLSRVVGLECPCQTDCPFQFLTTALTGLLSHPWWRCPSCDRYSSTQQTCMQAVGSPWKTSMAMAQTTDLSWS